MKRMFRPFSFLLAAGALMLAPGAAHAERQWIVGGPNPVRYEISITPNGEAGTFAGETRIEIDVPEATRTVTMNALDLTIERATIDGQRASVALDAEAQTLTLTARRDLRPGRHEIHIVYNGRILDDAYGLFRVSYEEANGQAKRALATQFEPGDARRLAPMWDQPNRRAVFAMTITAPSELMSVSNMPAIESTQLRNGLTRTRFADSPLMSSYLRTAAVVAAYRPKRRMKRWRGARWR